jgi:hypothetical protein
MYKLIHIIIRMGAHCCRWVCRPCAPRRTVKDKVKELFQPSPGHPEEHHAKIKTDKLIDYLKDRKQELKHCANEFARILAQETHESLSAAEVSKYKIALCSLKLLVGSFKEYFLIMSYKLSYYLMSSQDFNIFQEYVYDLISESCSLYPGDKPAVLQDISIDIIHHATTHPNKITEKELHLLTELVKALRSELVKGQRKDSGLSWQNVLSIVLIRIIQGYTSSSSYETNLISILAESLCTQPQSTQEFLNYIIDTLESNQAWNEKSAEIFEACTKTMNSIELFCKI